MLRDGSAGKSLAALSSRGPELPSQSRPPPPQRACTRSLKLDITSKGKITCAGAPRGEVTVYFEFLKILSLFDPFFPVFSLRSHCLPSHHTVLAAAV